ncbi:MAG: triose-phosphate isomerase [Dehalococcoidia bacterium]
MPTTIVAGNWKMNTTLDDAVALAQGVREGYNSSAGVEVVLCPPAISISAVREAVQGFSIKVGAQNMYSEDSGAFTGEISPQMLQGLCEYVILGHSERRQLFGESDQQINQKVKAAIKHGLKPIFCVGETLEQRESGHAAQLITNQVHQGLADLDDITGLVLAYEPVWAIGTGQAATPEIAAEIMGGVIRSTLQGMFGNKGAEVSLLYGGSVNPGNIADFAAQECIHGALVGGASLQAAQFLEIITKAEEAKAH